MDDHLPIPKLSLVGQTDAGKTAIIRTFLRNSSLGEMSPEAGSTQQIENYTLYLYDQNREILTISDTPGFQRLHKLRLEYLENSASKGSDSISGICDFLDHGLGDIAPTFLHDSLSWHDIADSDAVIAVIDVSEDPAKPSYPRQSDLVYFLRLIQKEKHVLVLLNKLHLTNSKTDEWVEILNNEQIPFVKYDANHSNIASDTDLFNRLADFFPKHREILNKKKNQRAEENRNRHETTLIEISRYLLKIAQTREGVSLSESNGHNKSENRILNIFSAAEKSLVKSVTKIWGFKPTIVSNAGVFHEHTRFVNKIHISPSTRRIAVGAAIGALADIPLFGLSFGSGSIIGAAAGGALGKVYDIVAHKAYGSSSDSMFLIPDTDFLRLAITRSLGLYRALSERGHGASIDDYNLIDLNKVLPHYIDPAVEFLQEKSVTGWASSFLAIHKFVLKNTQKLFVPGSIDPDITKLKQILVSLSGFDNENEFHM